MKGDHTGDAVSNAKKQLEKGADLMRLIARCINPNSRLPVCKIAVFTDSSVPSKDHDPSFFRFNKDRVANFGSELNLVMQELYERVYLIHCNIQFNIPYFSQ